MIFWLGDRDAKAGDHVALRALWTDNPGHFEGIAPRCLSKLAVSDPQVATLDRDGQGVVLAANAPDGTFVTISAMLGTRTITGRIRVAALGANPLIGLWREHVASRCAIKGVAPSPIGELEFRGDGMFSITWQPFELRHDYTGNYRYNRASGALSLEIDGGSVQSKKSRQAGRARLTGNHVLTLSGFDLGAPLGRNAHAPRCTIIFDRS